LLCAVRRLLQEEAHWLQLQQQYNDMHTTAAGAADADAAGADGVARVAAAAAAEAADSAGVAAAEPGAADKEAATAAAAGTGEAAAVAAAGGDGPVCAQQEAKVRGVQLKVEMLLALVSKMEHLVGSAETAARTLQVSCKRGDGCAALCTCMQTSRLLRTSCQQRLPNPAVVNCACLVGLKRSVCFWLVWLTALGVASLQRA
jgi:hypothetical protein